MIARSSLKKTRAEKANFKSIHKNLGNDVLGFLRTLVLSAALNLSRREGTEEDTGTCMLACSQAKE